MNEVPLGEHFGTRKHNSICFKVVMQNDSTVPQINVQNWSKADLGGIGQKLAEIDWVSQFASKGRAGK